MLPERATLIVPPFWCAGTLEVSVPPPAPPLSLLPPQPAAPSSTTPAARAPSVSHSPGRLFIRFLPSRIRARTRPPRCPLSTPRLRRGLARKVRERLERRPRVERVPQAVAQQVEGEGQDQQCE